jgi:phage tail-like protein
VADNAILRLAGPDIQQESIEVIEGTTFKIGRLEANDLALKHQKVSRFHAELELTKDGLAVKDLGSSNGTIVGKDQLEPEVTRFLEVGESVEIGPFTLTVDKINSAEKAEVEELPPTRAVSIEEVEKAVKEEAEKVGKTEKVEAEDLQSPEEEVEEQVEEEPEPEKKKPAPPKKKKTTSQSKKDAAASVEVVEPPEIVHPDYRPPRDVEKYIPPEPPTIPPRVPLYVSGNGLPEPLQGIPTEKSSWLEYLPPIYSEDYFTGRFLLIFESIEAPLEWLLDGFDYYLDAKFAPPDWLQWFGSWVDILVPATIPVERQRLIVMEMAQLFRTRGTVKSLTRHLELVFDTEPKIKEPEKNPFTFEVELKLGKEGNTEANQRLARRIIEAHRPAFTDYTLKIK